LEFQVGFSEWAEKQREGKDEENEEVDNTEGNALEGRDMG